MKRNDFNKYCFWTVGVLIIWLFCVLAFFNHSNKQIEAVKQPTPTPKIEILEVEVEKIRYATEKENIEHREEEIEALCKTVWGEARGCSKTEQAAVVWCVLNRVENENFPNDIIGVLTQPGQFNGYILDYPIDGEIYVLVNDVLNRWAIEDEAIGDVAEYCLKTICGFGVMVIIITLETHTAETIPFGAGH